MKKYTDKEIEQIKRWRGQGLGGTFGPEDIVMQEDSSNTVAWGRLYKTMMEYGNQYGCHILVIFSLLLERYFCFTKVILLCRDMRLIHSRREYLCA